MTNNTDRLKAFPLSEKEKEMEEAIAIATARENNLEKDNESK